MGRVETRQAVRTVCRKRPSSDLSRSLSRDSDRAAARTRVEAPPGFIGAAPDADGASADLLFDHHRCADHDSRECRGAELVADAVQLDQFINLDRSSVNAVRECGPSPRWAAVGAP
jgi:hypothetical protein